MYYFSIVNVRYVLCWSSVYTTYSVLRSSWYLRYGNITLQTVLLYVVVVLI